MTCLNNSNKCNPILMIFGKKYRHIIYFYWHLLFLRYAVKQRTSLGFSIDNESIG